MKTVVSNHMIAHLWAHQSQERAKSGNGNFWFNETTIYSYQTPIANFVTAPSGERVALISEDRYSPTTGQHISMINDALGYGHDRIVFDVPFIGKMGGWTYSCRKQLNASGDIHISNLAALLKRYHDAIATAGRARNLSDWVKARARELLSTAQAYAELFQVPLETVDFDADWQAVEAKHAGRRTPEAKAKAEKAKARRIERARRDYREVRGIYGENWHDTGYHHLGTFAREGIFTDEDRVARTERISLIAADKITAWRQGRGVSLPWREGGALLRVRGPNIETSRGAVFPAEHGKKAFALIAACRKQGREYQRNGHTIHLGPFALDRISATGDVHAGCHFVPWTEIELTARTLGLIP